MPRQPGANPDTVRAQIADYLATRDGQHATQPEIRAHLVRRFHYTRDVVLRYTAAAIRDPSFLVTREAHSGPRTVHVRLAPPRRRLRR